MDNIIVVNNQPITKIDIFSSVDDVIEDLNQTNDDTNALRIVNALDNLSNVTGRAKAKLLWGIHEWHKFNRPEDDFGEYILSSSSALQSKQKVFEYVNVWEQIEQENIPKKIQERPMRDLVPICNMLAQGHDPTKREWDKIATAANPSDLGEIIREIKGKPPRKSGMLISIDVNGSLYVTKNTDREFVGYLNVDGLETPLIASAIERIISGAGIVRR